MKRENQYKSIKSSCVQEVLRIKWKKEEILTEELVSEHRMEVYIDGTFVFEIICTPENLMDLVVGRLFSEGFICSCEDIEILGMDANGENATVIRIRRKEELPQDMQWEELQPVQPGIWKDEWICTLAEMFQKELPVYRKTRATHCCFLMTDGKVVFQCEDIRRHNVVDKAIGYILRSGIERSRCILYISGRMPTDMVQKVIRAGIPVLVSKELPTKEAVELGKAYNLTIIGNAKNQEYRIYTWPDQGDER